MDTVPQPPPATDLAERDVTLADIEYGQGYDFAESDGSLEVADDDRSPWADGARSFLAGETFLEGYANFASLQAARSGD